MRRSAVGIEVYSPLILSYNATKVFGARVHNLPTKIVLGMLIVDDIVNEHHKMELENAEARARSRM